MAGRAAGPAGVAALRGGVGHGLRHPALPPLGNGRHRCAGPCATFAAARAERHALLLLSSGYGVGYGIALDSSENVLVTGTYQENVTIGNHTIHLWGSSSTDALVAKYTSSGAQLPDWSFGE